MSKAEFVEYAMKRQAEKKEKEKLRRWRSKDDFFGHIVANIDRVKRRQSNFKTK